MDGITDTTNLGQTPSVDPVGTPVVPQDPVGVPPVTPVEPVEPVEPVVPTPEPAPAAPPVPTPEPAPAAPAVGTGTPSTDPVTPTWGPTDQTQTDTSGGGGTV